MNTLPIMRSFALILITLCAQITGAHTDIETQLASVNQMLESRPNDSSLYLIRGELKRHSEDWLGAEFDFAQADRLGSVEVRDQVKQYRGRLFQEAGQARRCC